MFHWAGSSLVCYTTVLIVVTQRSSPQKRGGGSVTWRYLKRLCDRLGHRQKLDRFTAWNLNVGKPIYNIHTRYDLVQLRDSTRSTSELEFVFSNKQKKSSFEDLVWILARSHARVFALYLAWVYSSLCHGNSWIMRDNELKALWQILLAFYIRFPFQNRRICQLFYKLFSFCQQLFMVYTFQVTDYWFRKWQIISTNRVLIISYTLMILYI